MWQRAVGRKLLCFMVLVIIGASNSDETSSGEQEDNETKNCIESVIPEEHKTSLCQMGGFRCYVECIFDDLITNMGACKNPIVEQITILKQTADLSDLTEVTELIKMCDISFASDKCIGSKKKCICSSMNFEFEGPTKTYKCKDSIMTVVKMYIMNTTDDGHVKISAPKLSGDDPPIDVFVPVEPFLNVSKKQSKVGIVTHHSDQQFLNDSRTVLKSKVMSVEAFGQKLNNLSNLLVINFTVNSREIIPENHKLSCQFFNETEHRWDDMGSFTNLKYLKSSNIVSCSYNHMTPFAVLLVNMNVTQIDTEQWKILSFITYIGCSLSAFFSAVTIFIYTFMKSSKRDSSIHIHVSLSVALFLLNTSFLFIEWGATWSQDSLCVLIAVIIQYSLLSCFSWMAIEAVHLYLLLIKVFNTHIKHYMVKLSLFGWGVPAILVGGSLCVYDSTPFYGTTKIKLSDTNETTQFCWITDHRFLYGMNITYVSLTLLFNTCILVAVTHQIFKLRCLNVRGSKLPSCKDVCTVLGLTMLLGMTWGLAFFTSGYTNYPILYLFCICNTLQGLFLFLWFYGTMKRNKRLEEEPSILSEPASSTVNTYESSFT